MYRVSLRDDVDAAAVLVHHLGQAGHLLDPIEAFLA
jgi:hypothetical protein